MHAWHLRLIVRTWFYHILRTYKVNNRTISSPPPARPNSTLPILSLSPVPAFTVCSADLSGQVLERPLALEWGKRILREFQLQARLEANAGLPRTTVANGDLETTIKGQHFFVSKVGVGLVDGVFFFFFWSGAWRGMICFWLRASSKGREGSENDIFSV